MNSFPSDWPTITLAPDFVMMTTGFACAKKNLVPDGMPHLRPFNIDTRGELDLGEVYRIPRGFQARLESYHLKPGDVLFNNTNSVELVGKSAIVRAPIDCGFSNHITRLQVTSPAQLAPQWLLVCLRHLWHSGFFAENCNRWIGQAGFNSTKLQQVTIPLPPLETQRRIVARLDALFDELTEARRLHAAIEMDTSQLMDAVLKDIFSRVERLCPGARRIEQFAHVSSGGTPPRQNPDYYSGTIPWIKTGELRDGMIYDSEEHITQEAIDNSNAKLFPVGTLLIAMYGQGQTRGRTGILAVPATTNQACCAIFPQADVVDSRYLQFWFRSMYSELRQKSEFRGGNQPNLNAGMIRSLKPPLPGLEQQRSVSEFLRKVQDETDTMRTSQVQNAGRLAELEQSILAQAFRGEL